ncbi:MAG: cupredoxin family copper-binding protein [Patescibacteria group bacterium]
MKGNAGIIATMIILAGLAATVFYWLFPPESKITIPPPAPAAKSAPKTSVAPQYSAPAPAAQPASQPAGQVTIPPFTSSILVSIKGFSYVSESVSVKRGTKVTWTNFDQAGHTVTSDTGLFASKILSQGKSFEYVFTQPGTYTYHCAPHPSMKGEIIVQ